MKIIKGQVEGAKSNKTVMIDENDHNSYYVVSTVKTTAAFHQDAMLIDETAIFKSNKDGIIVDDQEVFVLMPGNHDKVINWLLDGTLTTKDFS